MEARTKRDQVRGGLVHCIYPFTDGGDPCLHTVWYSFNAFLAIHQLWLDYMAELMALSMPPTSRQPADAHPMPNASALHAKLIKADFHGALITGTSSGVLRHVGRPNTSRYYSSAEQKPMFGGSLGHNSP